MLGNYLLVAVRNFLKDKTFTVINILGLALAVATSIVIVLFAKNELTYDRHNAKSGDIYLVYKERITPNGVQPTYDTWVPLKDELKNQFPEVSNATRIFQSNEVITADNRRFEDNVYYADPEFFQIFDFPLLAGNKKEPFPDNLSVVISKQVSEKFFGSQDPLGKIITLNYQTDYKITGVLRDYPSNSFICPEIIIPIQGHPDYKSVEKEWGSSFLFTYILLDQNSSPENLEAKFPGLIKNIWSSEMESRTKFKLLGLENHYDVFIGDSSDNYLLLYIALGIILIAVINFMNLSTARSLERAKEIGMRKVIGARFSQLVFQFLSEAILLSILGTVLGIFIAGIILPMVNASFAMDLAIPFSNYEYLILAAGFAILLGLLSGVYPAFYMARVKVLESFKENRRINSSGLNIRNILVVFQFALALVLIIGSLTISRQIRYMKNSNLAFEKENLMVIPLQAGDFENPQEAQLRIETFKNELSRHSGVATITASRHVPGRWSESYLFVRPEGWEGNPMRMRYTYIDASFFKTYDIGLLQGTGFLPDENGDQRGSAIINEAAMQAFGWKDIQDKAILIGDNRMQVVGMIRDFNYETLKQKIDPMIFFHRVSSNPVNAYLTVRITPGHENEIKKFAANKWQVLNSDRDFTYFYMDDEMKSLYAGEERLLSVIQGFSLLSIIISCLGLFGLTSFIVNRRKKEIGIRKVLGAQVMGLTLRFSGSFLKLIIISFIMAGPVSYYFMSIWLKSFAFKINQSLLIYLGSVILLAVIAGFTVAGKTIAAAKTNPVKSLREN